MKQAIDLLAIYIFLKRLVTPFDQTKAYQLGLIDENGKRLKKAETKEEKNAMTYFDRLIFNLKRLLATIPGGKSQIATFAAALLLLREEDERLNEDEQYLKEELYYEFINMDINMFEEVAANATGAAVPGTGDNQAHWVDRKRKKKRDISVLRRKS